MSILTQAITLVHNGRQQSYGTPTENWTKTAELVNALLSHKLNAKLTPEECAMVMIQVKLARELHAHKDDNLIDIAGYAEVIGAIGKGY